MKKWISFILCALLCVGFCITASAASPYVIDQAGLLTESEIAQLEQTAVSYSSTYDMDVVILTLDSLLGKTSQAAADDYYDEHGYSPDGVLFLLAMEEREWYISTSGKAIYALTDYGLYEIEEAILPYLQSGDYFGAFDTFQQILPYYLDAYFAGDNIDGYVPVEDQYHGHTDVVYEDDESDFLASLIIGCGAGLIVAAIAVLIMRFSMNTKRAQHSAGDYLKAGSYHLRTNRDVFLYSQVTKQPRPQENSSSSGGGSGVHRSSSGSSHGGRGGKF